MNQDASFEDGHETALNLGALGAEDLQVLSTLLQDAVFPAAEMAWNASQRRFAILLNRFRWEDPALAAQGSQAAERVQAVLAIDNVLAVASQGIDRTDKAMVFSVLSLLRCGAIFGFFDASTCSTFWGLDKIDIDAAITTMPAINTTVRNAGVALAFSDASVVLLPALCWRMSPQPTSCTVFCHGGPVLWRWRTGVEDGYKRANEPSTCCDLNAA